MNNINNCKHFVADSTSVLIHNSNFSGVSPNKETNAISKSSFKVRLTVLFSTSVSLSFFRELLVRLLFLKVEVKVS